MPAYVSTQTGDWNDVNTWGGGGWPNVAADTATISAGHTVYYNVDSAIELGNVTIAATGTLRFLGTLSTRMVLGATRQLIVNGTLELGTVTVPVDEAYTCQIRWNATGGMITIDGNTGRVQMYDDPDYYGGSSEPVQLASAWDAGQTFTIVGDYTTRWKAGQILLVFDGKSCNGSAVQRAKLFTIFSLVLNGSNTDVTIVEAAPGPAWTAVASRGLVWNTSRNIIIGTYYSETTYYFNMDTFAIAWVNFPTTDYSLYSRVGMDRFRGKFIQPALNAALDLDFDGVICHTNTALVYAYRCHFQGLAYSTWYGFNRMYGCTIDWDILGSLYCYQYTQGCIFNGDIIDCSMPFGFNTGWSCDCVINGDLISNGGGLYGLLGDNNVMNGRMMGIYSWLGGFPTRVKIRGSIGWDKQGISMPSFWFDIYLFSGDEEVVFEGAKMPLGGLTAYYWTYSSYLSKAPTSYAIIPSANHNQVQGAHHTYNKFSDIDKNVVVTREGHESSLEITPKLWMRKFPPDTELIWREQNVPVVSQTRSVFVRGAAWGVFPDATELWFEAEYPSGAVINEKTIIKSVQVLSANDVWTELSVTFVPTRIGEVVYRLYFGKYQAAAKIYVDGFLNRTGMRGVACTWWGNSKMNVDYNAGYANPIGGKHVIAVD